MLEVDDDEHIVLEKTLKRKDLLTELANINPCIAGMEAGTGPLKISNGLHVCHGKFSRSSKSLWRPLVFLFNLRFCKSIILTGIPSMTSEMRCA